MMGYKIQNGKVMKMTKMNISGNVVPISWFNHLKFGSGKPNLPAIMILSDIIYWYRAQAIRDEETGMVVEYKQKFKSDMLQKQYKLWMDLYGFGRSQTKNAVDYLEEKGLINREFRDVNLPTGEIAYNRMFVEPIPEKIEMITYPEKENEKEGSFQNKEGVISKSGGGDSKIKGSSSENEGDPTSKQPGGHSEVNSTESTTESTTEITTDVNNKKGSDFSNSDLDPKIIELFKASFNSLPNTIQLEKLESYNFDSELMLETIKGIGIGGHNQTYMFNKFDMFKKDGIKSLKDLKSKKSKSNDNTYKWADHFFDWDNLKPEGFSDEDEDQDSKDTAENNKKESNHLERKEIIDKINNIDQIYENQKDIQPQELYNHIKSNLRPIINTASYNSWISELEFVKFEDGILSLRAENKFSGEWVEKYYLEYLERIGQKLAGTEIDIFIKKGKE